MQSSTEKLDNASTPYPPPIRSYDLQERILIHRSHLNSKGPNHVVVVFEPSPSGRGDNARLRGISHLLTVPAERTGGHFLFSVRQKVNLHSSETLFVYIRDKVALTMSATMGDLARQYKDSEDGMLYLYYTRENTFGSC
eukprot:PhF_6_TR14309/c0_g1_i1/m.22976/K08341/GABARAP, ATG8, LC3; GABA(A) receptor-associated protein